MAKKGARRDPTAFGDFVTARSTALHRTAYLMVGDPHLAQDLVQEALTKTYVAWPRLRDISKAEAYTRKAITTTAISWFRRKSWGERAVEEVPEPSVSNSAIEGHAASVTQQEWLWQAIGTLPPRQRIALILRFYEDLTEAQTAEVMDCAVGTIKSQVSAALAKLRLQLGDDAELAPSELPFNYTVVKP